MDYAGHTLQECKVSETLTLRESLTNQLRQAKVEVARLEELVTFLGQHPEVNRILELLGRR